MLVTYTCSGQIACGFAYMLVAYTCGGQIAKQHAVTSHCSQLNCELEKYPVNSWKYHANSGKPHPIQPSACHKESIGMSTLYFGPKSSEELFPGVKGFTFIVILD